MAGPGAAHGCAGRYGGGCVMLGVMIAMSLASGLVAGVFYGFSDFIMRSLRAVPEGAAAMVSINRVILRSSFVPLLIGLGPLALALAAWAYWAGGSLWAVAAGVIYAFGVVGVTIVGNVPLNNRLDRAADPATVWADYLARWTPLNTLRTVAAAAASLCYLQAALAIAGQAVT